MVKPLLRTMPSLSGNVKIACQITDVNKIDDNENIYEAYVRQAQLESLSSTLTNYFTPISLLSSSYEWDIRTFYRKYTDSFYKNMFSFDRTDLPMYNEYGTNKTRNTDFEFGLKRVSYSRCGKQFAFFAPLYIDSADDIPDYFEITFFITCASFTTTRKLQINIGRNLTKLNYLGKYIYEYLEKIDSNVVYLDHNENIGLYYGIDVENGGFANKYDKTCKTLFLSQQTITNFDNLITQGFQRKKLVVRQILPLAFYFNFSDILSELELTTFYGAELSISGQWIKNNRALKFNDFNCDYISFMPEIKKLNNESGSMVYTTPTSLNIMNMGYPSVRESLFYKYRFTNKLTKTFGRWKLKYSADKHPYITNMSPAFNFYQNSNYRYGEFPIMFGHINALATKKPYYLNLMLPLNGGEKIYSLKTVEKYQNIHNNYGTNWFDIFYDINDVFRNSVPVQDNKAYFNGILYDLSNIKNSLNKPINIDKFGVFIQPNFINLSLAQIRDEVIFSKYVIYKENSNYISKPNCHVTDNILSASNKRIFDNLYTSVKQDELASNVMFIENTSGNGDFISLQDYKVDWYEANSFYKVSDLENVIEEDIYRVLATKAINSKDIIPIYYLSNILNKYNKIYNEIIDTGLLNIGEFGVSKAFPISAGDEIDFSSEELKESTQLYSKILYRSGKFIDKSVAKTVLLDYYGSLYDNYKITRGLDYFNAYINDKYEDFNATYLSDMTSYQYNIKLSDTSGDDYAIYTFSAENGISSRTYGRHLPENFLKYDKDFLYVDPYNINNIIDHYNNKWLKDSSEKLSYIYDTNVGSIFSGKLTRLDDTNSLECYSKFLDRKHLYFYIVKIHRNANILNFSTTLEETRDKLNALNNIFVRRRVLTDDLTVKDEFTPLSVFSNWKNINTSNNTQMLEKISSIISNIVWDEAKSLFYFADLKYNEITKYYETSDYKNIKVEDVGDPSETFYFDLVFKKRLCIVDNNIWKLMNLEETYAAPYKDLYIYELEHDSEFNRSLKINIKKPNSALLQERGILKPLFNIATIEDLDETKIYTEYSINNITKAFYKESTFYRHNCDDEICMFDISTRNKDIPYEINGIKYLLADDYDKFITENEDEHPEYKNTYAPFVYTFDRFETSKVNFINAANVYQVDKLAYTETYQYTTYIKVDTVYDEQAFLEYCKNNPYTYWMTYYDNSLAYIEPGEYSCDDNKIENSYCIKKIMPPKASTITVSSWQPIDLTGARNIYETETVYSYYNDLNLYDYFKLSTYDYIDKEGNKTTYGFYTLEQNINNSINCFNVSSYEGEHIKFINYLNGESLDTNPMIITELYKQILPFIKVNPFTYFARNCDTLYQPTNIPLEISYVPKMITTTNGKLAYFDIVNDFLQRTTVVLQRYFDQIVPSFNETAIVSSYAMKYKDIKKTFKVTYFTNETIYPTPLSINNYPGVRVYDTRYSNSYVTKFDWEYKHFNDNLVINLEEHFVYRYENYLTKLEVAIAESDTKVFEVFANHLQQNFQSTLDNDGIRWAFTKYDVKFSCAPVILDNSLTEKLYELEISFTLF